MYKKKKKVLIITYYWPPAGGPGVQRVLNFVKHLSHFGWEPIVLTVEDGEFPAIDKSLLSSISKDIKVVTSKSLEPFALYKRIIGKQKDHKIDTYILNQKKTSPLQSLMKWIRLNIFVPDARIGWYPYAVKKGKKIIEEEGIDVIYTCSPPHSLQLIGRKLAKAQNIPWVADFRDPWTSLVAYQGQDRSSLTMKLDSNLEKSVFKKADKLIVTCNGLKQAMVDSFKVDQHKINVITNGYEHLNETTSSDIEEDKIVIFYAGNLSVVRIPFALIDALESISKMKTKASIEFRIAGNVCAEFWDIVKEKKISHLINYIGYLSHIEVIQNYSQVNFLLQVVDDVADNHLFVAGKLFDYLGSKKPIIAIGPLGGEVQQIIEEPQSGYFFDYTQKDELKVVLEQILNLEIDINRSFSFIGIEKYSRKELTKKLALIFDELHLASK